MRQLIGLSLAIFVAGCGSSSSPHVATSPSARPSTTTRGEAPATGHFQASVNYINCMRRQGVLLPDPQPSGDIELTPSDEQRLAGVSQAKHDAADAHCAHFLNGFVSIAPISDQALARVADVALAFAACMRNKGYEFGDPQVTRAKRGRLRILFPDAPFPRDPPGTHPKLDAAMAICNRGFNKRVDDALNR